jgi:peptidase inhibitor family I36/beta/gamma crystallin
MKKFLFYALCCVFPFVVSAQGITVYMDANFQGRSKTINNDQQFVGPDWNDQISSIRIPAGYRIEVFADANFGGASRVLDNDWTISGRDMEWNDKISSIRILSYPGQRHSDEGAGSPVMIFSDVNFQGMSRAVVGDERFVGDAWNDKISSIRIAPGYKIQVYVDANFGGGNLVLDRDWTAGGNQMAWNDQISSIRILETPSGRVSDRPMHEATGDVIVYEHANFQGRSKVISGDVSFVGNDFNDMISSIRIPRGMEVEVFVDANYGGASKIFYDDWNTATSSPEWNDKISSIKIRRR